MMMKQSTVLKTLAICLMALFGLDAVFNGRFVFRQSNGSLSEGSTQTKALRNSTTALNSTSDIRSGRDETRNVSINEETNRTAVSSKTTSSPAKISVHSSNASSSSLLSLGHSVSSTTVPVMTVITQLSGEMGNNIGKFCHGLAISDMLQRQHHGNIRRNVSLVLRHQEHSKWKRGHADLKRCFPETRSYDFAQGNTAEFQEKFQYLQKWLGKETLGQLKDINSADKTEVDHALRIFAKLTSTYNNRTVNNDSATISMPFLYSNRMVGADFFVDQYYDEFRRFFRFDDAACCALKAEPDESVFHFRNFLTEMPRVGKRLGFQELGANQTARDLFGHLRPGEKVAIITRFGAETAQPYVDALERRGLKVRVVSGQTGVEDFCFLLTAQKEIAGSAISTFFFWSGVLGNSSIVRSYSLDTPERRKRRPGDNLFVHYNWTHPELKKRFIFEFYKPNSTS